MNVRCTAWIGRLALKIEIEEKPVRAIEPTYAYFCASFFFSSSVRCFFFSVFSLLFHISFEPTKNKIRSICSSLTHCVYTNAEEMYTHRIGCARSICCCFRSLACFRLCLVCTYCNHMTERMVRNVFWVFFKIFFLISPIYVVREKKTLTNEQNRATHKHTHTLSVLNRRWWLAKSKNAAPKTQKLNFSIGSASSSLNKFPMWSTFVNIQLCNICSFSIAQKETNSFFFFLL